MSIELTLWFVTMPIVNVTDKHCIIISGGHATHRHLAALADGDADDEEKATLKPNPIEDASKKQDHNGGGEKDAKEGKKVKVKKEASSSQGRK